MIKKIMLMLALLSSITLFGQIKDKPILTAEQSWALVLSGRRIDGGYDHFKSINPHIKTKLVKLIKDDKFVKYKYNMIMTLACIDDASAKLIESQIKDIPQGVVKGNEHPGLYINALCLMSSRGEKEARSIVKKMLEPSYWKDIKFRWVSGHVKQNLNFEYYSIWRAWTSYALSGHSDFAEQAKIILSNYPQKSDKSYTYLKACLNVDKIYREIEHRKTDRGKEVLAIEDVVFTDEFLKHLDEYYLSHVLPVLEGKDLSKDRKGNPVILDKKRSRALMTLPEDKFLRTLYEPQKISTENNLLIVTLEKQANDFFNHIKSSLLERKYDVIANQVLDNGKVVPSYKYKNNKEALLKELDIQREMFSALGKVGYEKNGLQIRKNDLFVKVENNSMLEWKKLEEITVTFELKGNQNLYRKFFKRISPSAMRTMSDNKNFQVYFKRINGKWFWNPFGW